MSVITPEHMKKQIDGTKMSLMLQILLKSDVDISKVNVNKISQLADQIMSECEIGRGRNVSL